MINESALASIIIHTFLETPEEKREDLLKSIYELCDNLGQSKFSVPEDINLIIERSKND